MDLGCDGSVDNDERDTDLQIVKVSPAFVDQGDLILYNVAVANLGASAAENVQVIDTVPQGLQYVQTFSDSTCALNGTTVTCSLGTVNVNALKTITIAMQVPLTTQCQTKFTNKATVATSVKDINPFNNESTTQPTEVECPVPALTITKTDNQTQTTPGATLTYQIIVTDVSGIVGQNIVVRDALPTELTFVSASDGGTNASGLVIWPGPTIQPGQSKTLTLTATVKSTVTNGAVIANLATIQDGPSATDTTVVSSQTGFSLTKTDNRTSAQPGEILTYSLTVTNLSSQTASNVTLTDTLPSDLSFISASDGESL